MIQESATSSAGVLSSYHPQADTFDEMCDASGALRSHWQPTINSLNEIGVAELTQIHRESVRLLRENGVTYNVYDDPKGAWRPWSFDPIPFLVADPEWKELEAGLVERAEVWDLLLRDLYGPRQLIRTGVLPPEVIDGDPRYLRACHALRPPEERMLYLSAVDIGRRNDGSFIVLEDRTQAPSGAGYAVENRIISARVLPDLYRDTQVHRLAVFFRSMLSSLSAAAPDDKDEPRMVLLTPGPGNETYFEHSYLAHYLGLTLVEGSDLVVRDSKVYLRTLDGLERIDVIVRRVDDTYCDPLELRSDSVLGVPGLLSAIRAGTVVVANPPGTGICESPSLNAFIPEICRAILGREPKLSTAKSWWCGKPADLEYVLANLESLAIRSIRARIRPGLIWPSKMSSEEIGRLRDSICRDPSHFAAREVVPLSTTPVLGETGFEPRELVLRTFLVSLVDSYVVMPGGLTRVSGAREVGGPVSSQEGGVSKDTWVLSAMPPRFVTLLQTGVRPLELRRSGGEIASRVAENLYWLGRYADRAEGTARLLRSITTHLLEARNADNDVCPPDLLRTLTHLTTTYPGFAGDERLLDHPDDELLALIVDSQRSGTLAFSLESLRRTSQSARDRLSDDMWRIVNKLGEELVDIQHMGEAVEPLGRVILHLSALAGLISDSMTRGPGFWFVDFGKRLERAVDTINLLRSVFFFADEFIDPMAEALLEVTDSVMTYRRRYKSRLNPAGVLDLLLFDKLNPRSVAFQLNRLRDLLSDLPSKQVPITLQLAQQTLLQAFGSLGTTDIDIIGRRSEDGSVPAILDNTLLVLDGRLRRVSNIVCAAYFAQVQAPRQLVEFQ